MINDRPPIQQNGATGLAGTAIILGYIAAGVLQIADFGSQWQSVLETVSIAIALSSTLLLVFYPKMLMAITMLCITFAQSLAALISAPAITEFDDALIATAVVALCGHRLMRGESLRKIPGSWWWLIVLALGAASSLYHAVPAPVAATGAFLLLKGPLLGFAAAQVDWKLEDLDVIRRAALISAPILVGICIVNLLVEPRWTRLLSNSNESFLRISAIPSLIGPFIHPSFLAQMAALLAITLVVVRNEFGGVSRFWIGSVILCSLLSFRKKTWLALPIGLYFSQRSHGRLKTLAFGTPALIALATIAWGPITNFVSATGDHYFGGNLSTSPRVALYLGASDIAIRDLPLGAGFGRWGSEPARSSYSPEYLAAGFKSYDGLNPADTSYATDTFWPVVIGETGLVGVVAYVAGLVSIVVFGRKLARGSPGYSRVIGLILCGWSSLLLVESVAAPVFMGPPTFPWLFVAAGVGIVVYEWPPLEEQAAANTSRY